VFLFCSQDSGKRGATILRQAHDERKKAKRRYVRFTRWRRRRFFALLGESGNVRMACELSGVGLGCIYRLRRTEAGFVALMEAAVAGADARLAKDEREGEEAPPPCFAWSPSPANAGEDLDLVIRRGIGGRLRVMAAGTRWWAARHDAVFLGHLRATGNVVASARAAGFTKKAAYDRRARMPSFARAWDSALDEAENWLQWRLIEEAEKGTPAMERGAGEAASEEAENKPFDPWLALWLLKYWEGQRSGRIRPRWGAFGEG
jgi:hypothetical protein